MRINESTAFEDLPVLLTVREAALWAGVTKIHLYRHIVSGDIKAMRAGQRNLRISKDDLKTWMDTPVNPS